MGDHVARVETTHGMCDYVDGGEAVTITVAPMDMLVPGGVVSTSSLLILASIRAGTDCQCNFTNQPAGALFNAVQGGNRCYVHLCPRTGLEG